MNPSGTQPDQTPYPRPIPPQHGATGLRFRAARIGWLVLNMAFLISAAALFGAAMHYYEHMRESAQRGDPFYLQRVRNDDLRTVLYSIAGCFPLILGVRGEVKRITALEEGQQPNPQQPTQESI